jgi:hypothetical protein
MLGQTRRGLVLRMVPGTGLEPASLAAADFKSAMFTNFITPAERTRFYHFAYTLQSRNRAQLQAIRQEFSPHA